MMRTLLEYLTLRSLDRGTPPPTWLRWLSRRDPQLRQFARDAQELNLVLRVSAQTRRQALAEEPTTAAPARMVGLIRDRRGDNSRPRILPQVGWVAACAAAVLALAAFVNHTSSQRTNAERAKQLSAHLTSVPDEMLSLFAEAARSSQVYSPLTQLSLPQVNPWSDIPRGTQYQLQQAMNVWGSQLSALGEQVYERLDPRANAEIN